MQDENQSHSKAGEREGGEPPSTLWGDVIGEVTGNAGTRAKVTSRSADRDSRPTEWGRGGFDSVDPGNPLGVFMGAHGKASVGSKDSI